MASVTLWLRYQQAVRERQEMERLARAIEVLAEKIKALAEEIKAMAAAVERMVAAVEMVAQEMRLERVERRPREKEEEKLGPVHQDRSAGGLPLPPAGNRGRKLEFTSTHTEGWLSQDGSTGVGASVHTERDRSMAEAASLLGEGREATASSLTRRPPRSAGRQLQSSLEESASSAVDR
ncbi:MAG: hypothetical protein Q9225_001384 [Loekoesia sp. 1 TL-2023]